MSDEKPRLGGKLDAFVEYYVALAFNGRAAAKQAGYAGNDATLAVVASENLRKPKVAERIKERVAEVAMSADEVLLRLRAQARGDHAEFWEISPLGTPRLNFKALCEAGLAHLVKEYKCDADTGEVTEVKFYDAQAALALLGKHHRLFVDRQEVTATIDDATESTPDERVKRLEFLLNAARTRRDRESPSSTGGAD